MEVAAWSGGVAFKMDLVYFVLLYLFFVMIRS